MENNNNRNRGNLVIFNYRKLLGAIRRRGGGGVLNARVIRSLNPGKGVNVTYNI